jgi:hypothetical protein
MNFESFFNQFLITALWSSSDDNEQPLDRRFTVHDFTPEAAEVLRAHALSFWSRMYYYIEHEKGGRTDSDAGHDFWLTMNGHGAGFWDGDWPVYGEQLTKLAGCYPQIGITVTDDNRLSI